MNCTGLPHGGLLLLRLHARYVCDQGSCDGVLMRCGKGKPADEKKRGLATPLKL